MVSGARQASTTGLFLQLLRLRAVTARRWLGAHAFALFVLAPMVVGALLWVFDRYVPLVRAGLRDALFAGASPAAGSLLLAMLLTAPTWSALRRDIFPYRSPATLLDTLPIPEGSRFLLVWGSGLLRNLLLVVGLCAALALLARGTVSPGVPFVWGGRLVLAFLPLTALQILLILALVRLRHRYTAPLLAAVVVLVVWAARSVAPAAALVLLPWWPTADQLDKVLRQALGAPVHAAPGPVTALLAGLALTAVAGWLFVHQRRRHLATAAPSTARRRTWAAALLGRVRRPAMVQLVRDLLLLARRFSPVVYVAAALALVAEAAVLLAVPRLDLDAFLRGRLALTGCTLAVLCAAALAPLLLRHQLPRLWLERTSGLEVRQLWRAKVWLARCLALPLVLAGGLVALALGTPLSVAGLGRFLLELMAAAWIVASVVGLATFEVAEHPLIGLTWSAMIGLSLAGLLIFYPIYWPFWLTGYALLASVLADRATARARFTEVVR